MQLQVSEDLNKIIAYAREEAMRTGSYGIGPDHLFLGFIRHEDNTAFRSLQSLGVEPAELKVSSTSASSPTKPSRTSRWTTSASRARRRMS